jgi:hypothetical protein
VPPAIGIHHQAIVPGVEAGPGADHAGRVDVLWVHCGTAYVGGVQGIGNAHQRRAGNHLRLALQGHPQPQVAAVHPRGVVNGADAAQDDVEEALAHGDDLGLAPKGGTAEGQVIDLEGEGIVAVGHGGPGAVQEQALVVEKEWGAAGRDRSAGRAAR